MEDPLSCGLCTQNFTPSDPGRVDPQCGHSFCKGCAKHIEEQESFTCPSCRRCSHEAKSDRELSVVDESQLQRPEQVFLELSIEGKSLGHVNIKPWYHLRRAQHFAALCLGTFGVSYLGSTFKYVMNKGKPREYLMGGGYLSSKGQLPTFEDMMKDLEWGDEVSGDGREGLVFGAGDVKNGIYPEKGESGFGICTRDARGLTFQCPFGEVISGLDVVKRAVQFDPVTQVTITRCGSVIPEPGL